MRQECLSKLEYVLSRVEKHQAETGCGHKKYQSITTHPSSTEYTYSTSLLLQDAYIFNESVFWNTDLQHIDSTSGILKSLLIHL